MSVKNNYKSLLQKESGVKRLGNVTEINTGSVVFEDFQGRTFMASTDSTIDLKVGNTIIVVGEIVIGKTEIEADPTVFEV